MEIKNSTLPIPSKQILEIEEMYTNLAAYPELLEKNENNINICKNNIKNQIPTKAPEIIIPSHEYLADNVDIKYCPAGMRLLHYKRLPPEKRIYPSQVWTESPFQQIIIEYVNKINAFLSEEYKNIHKQLETYLLAS